MKNTLLTLLDHAIWADAQAHAAIASIDAARPERAHATRIYAHLAGSEHVWLARMEGRAPAHAIWPELPLDAAAALATESLTGLRAIAAGDANALAREVDYRNSTGRAFRNTIADIIAHVALHGSHHRGQLALLARQGGGTPAVTDYIAFVRGGGAPGAASAGASATPRAGNG